MHDPNSTCGLLTLLTDFGTSDGYVAAMKGIAYGIADCIRIVDITHEVPDQDVFRAAVILKQVAHHFPPGTVHVVVVDPGVGTHRRPLAVEARGQYFVGPDNGVLALAAPAPRRAHVIENTDLMRSDRSDTFHGRDIFAPVGAHLARGVDVARVGPEVEDMLDLAMPRPVFHRDSIDAEVIYADKYGNLMLNIDEGDLEGIDPASMQTTISGFVIEQLRSTYAEVEIGELVVYLGSSGYLEVARREGDARHYLGAPRGTRVVIRHAPR